MSISLQAVFFESGNLTSERCCFAFAARGSKFQMQSRGSWVLESVTQLFFNVSQAEQGVVCEGLGYHGDESFVFLVCVLFVWSPLLM